MNKLPKKLVITTLLLQAAVTWQAQLVRCHTTFNLSCNRSLIMATRLLAVRCMFVLTLNFFAVQLPQASLRAHQALLPHPSQPEKAKVFIILLHVQSLGTKTPKANTFWFECTRVTLDCEMYLIEL